jgi:multidrug efflux system membrane fusion protein
MSAAAPRRSRRIIAASIAFAVLAVTATAYYAHSPGGQSQAAAPADARPIPVPVAQVMQREVVTWDEFSGRLEAVERVDVRSRVAGAVQSIHFVEGALVNRNDLLVTIDPAPYAAEVDRTQAQVAAAQARVTYTKSELERGKRLAEDNAIARREVDERANAALEAEANLRGAQAALQSARLNLGYTQVRAPVAGRVGKIEITVGNLVAAGPGAPVLTTLVSVSPIYASFDADEQVIAGALKELPQAAGPRAPIQRIPVLLSTAAADDKPLAGHLQLVDNQINAKSGTVRVRAVFENRDGSLTPGQFATLRMGRAKASSALLVNERAVGTDQNKKFVMVVGEDSKAAYREITLGGTADGLRIVTSGLKPGERIVVNGLQRVRPGALVAPQPASMEAVHDERPRSRPVQS